MKAHEGANQPSTFFTVNFACHKAMNNERIQNDCFQTKFELFYDCRTSTTRLRLPNFFFTLFIMFRITLRDCTKYMAIIHSRPSLNVFQPFKFLRTFNHLKFRIGLPAPKIFLSIQLNQSKTFQRC